MQNTCTRNQGWTGPPRKWCSTSAPNPPGTATAVPLFLFRVTRAPELRQDSPAGGAGRTPRPFGSSSTPHLATRALSYSASPSCWRRMASSSSSPAPAPAGESLRQKRILSSKLYLDVPSSKVTLFLIPTFQESRGGPPSRVSIALFPRRRQWSTRRPTTSPSWGSRSCEPPSRPPATYAETLIRIQMCLMIDSACVQPLVQAPV
jgi:hypothetical protein